MGANVDATSGYRERLAGRHSDDALRDAVQRIRLGVHASKLPPKIKAFLDDMGRRDGRNQHPLGRYPEVAREAAMSGASLPSVLAPLTVLEAQITGQYYGEKLPGLPECQHTETNANNIFDHAQLRNRERLTKEGIDAAMEAGNEQIAATKRELAVLAYLRSKVDK